MKVNSVITLENDTECLIVDKANYNNTNYYLSVLLDEREEPTDISCVLKETIEGNDTYVEREVDNEILTELFKLFTNSFCRQVSELPEDAEN